MISGPAHAVDTAAERARSRGLAVNRLRVSHAFHSPLVAGAAEPLAAELAAESAPYPPGHRLHGKPSSLRSRLQLLPPLDARGLWDVQRRAVENLERSLQANRPRALIQMATGSGKTFTAISSAYRLVKFGGARRILFLVDRANLGRQALKEFQQYVTPDDGRKFTELYNVQHLTSNKLDPVARVVITTIQRLYSMLQGKELEPDLEEGSLFDSMSGLVREPVPVEYSPASPSAPSTSSSWTSATAPSTPSGARSWSISIPF